MPRPRAAVVLSACLFFAHAPRARSIRPTPAAPARCHRDRLHRRPARRVASRPAAAPSEYTFSFALDGAPVTCTALAAAARLATRALARLRRPGPRADRRIRVRLAARATWLRGHPGAVLARPSSSWRSAATASSCGPRVDPDLRRIAAQRPRVQPICRGASASRCPPVTCSTGQLARRRARRLASSSWTRVPLVEDLARSCRAAGPGSTASCAGQPPDPRRQPAPPCSRSSPSSPARSAASTSIRRFNTGRASPTTTTGSSTRAGSPTSARGSRCCAACSPPTAPCSCTSTTTSSATSSSSLDEVFGRANRASVVTFKQGAADRPQGDQPRLRQHLQLRPRLRQGPARRWNPPAAVHRPRARPRYAQFIVNRGEPHEAWRIVTLRARLRRRRGPEPSRAARQLARDEPARLDALRPRPCRRRRPPRAARLQRRRRRRAGHDRPLGPRPGKCSGSGATTTRRFLLRPR